jgi:hypothetical protein
VELVVVVEELPEVEVLVVEVLVEAPRAQMELLTLVVVVEVLKAQVVQVVLE